MHNTPNDSTMLITGGSGFIGGHFHNALDQQRIINLDLVAPTIAQQSEFVQGDIRIPADVRKSLEGRNVRTILNLAAKHHDFGIGHDEYFDTNEGGTQVICDTASELGIQEIIFYSSVAVYGLRDIVTNEQTPPQPETPYGKSKLAGEEVLKKWAAADPQRKVLIIRPAVVFGPNNMANMRSLIKQIDSGLYFHLGKADNIKSVVYVENLVQATLYLKDRLKPGVHIYNYADEPQLTARQIGDTIAEALGKKIRLTVPRALGIALALPFDLLIKITGKNIPISSARIKKLSTPTHHAAGKVFSEGYSPRYTTIDGLRKMVSWYKAEQKA